MALSKQAVPIVLTQGLDQKTDEKHVALGKLTRLENGRFLKRGRIDKRSGFDLIPNAVVGGGTLTEGDSLATFKDEALQYHGGKVYSYSPGAEAWVDKGSSVSVITRTRQVVKNTSAQTLVDASVSDGIGVYAYEDSRGGVRATVVDETTGTHLLSDTVIDASGSRPRVLSFQDFFFVFYYKSGSLWVRRINPLNPSSFDTAYEVSTTVNTTNPNYDVYSYAGLRMFFCHNVQGSAAVKVGWLNVLPALLTGVLSPSNVVTEAATDHLSVSLGASQTLVLTYYNSTDKFRGAVLNNGANLIAGPTTLDSTSTVVRNSTGVMSSTGITIYYELTASDSYNALVKQNTLTTAGTAGTASVFKRSVGLFTKSFSFTDASGETQSFVGCVHQSVFQSTYFMVRTDGTIASKQLYSVAGGLSSRPQLAAVSREGSVFYFPCLKKTRLVSESGAIFTPLGVSRTTLDFSNNDIFTAAELGDNLHIVGGVLSMYDGESVVEHGFHLYPENVAKVAAGSGGTMGTGTVSAVFVYEWTDNKGQIHRSATSLPISHTFGSGTTNKLTYTVPTLRLTAKDGVTRPNVSIVGYATTLTGSTYYRFTSVASPTYNDVTVDSVSIELTAEVAASNEILYTTGGVLDNFAAPACSTIAVFKNRIFVGGLEEGTDVWFSKERRDGEPVEFSDTFKKTIEAPGGKDTALAVLDDKLIVSKSDRFFYTYGDGPNALGTGGDFAEFEFLTGDVGITNANSVVRTPTGIMFKTAKGIYEMGSNLALSYIGADVEDFNGETVTSAVLIADENQVRFTTLSGPVLVYDYYFSQWSTDTGLSAKRAVNFNGKYLLLKTNGNVLQSNPNIFTDAGGSYALRVTTGWLSFDSIGGYQRCYRLYLTGIYKSRHKLRLKMSYDFSSASESQVVLDPDTALEISRYGDESPYGAPVGGVYGGINSAYRFEVDFERQKCETVKIDILEYPDSTGDQSALAVSDLSILAGIKGKLSRLPAQQKYGANT